MGTPSTRSNGESDEGRAVSAAVVVPDVEPVEAPHGEKMIEIRIRFWTDSMAEDGFVYPKHAWGSGMVITDRNDTHGIRAGDSIPFNSMAQLPAAIEKAMIASGIVLHKSRREKRYRQ